MRSVGQRIPDLEAPSVSASKTQRLVEVPGVLVVDGDEGKQLQILQRGVVESRCLDEGRGLGMDLGRVFPGQLVALDELLQPWVVLHATCRYLSHAVRQRSPDQAAS